MSTRPFPTVSEYASGESEKGSFPIDFLTEHCESGCSPLFQIAAVPNHFAGKRNQRAGRRLGRIQINRRAVLRRINAGNFFLNIDGKTPGEGKEHKQKNRKKLKNFHNYYNKQPTVFFQ